MYTKMLIYVYVVYEFEILKRVFFYSLSTYSFMSRFTLILFVWRFSWRLNTLVWVAVADLGACGVCGRTGPPQIDINYLYVFF